MLLDNTKGSCDAIRGSGNDAAGIARTLSAGKYPRMLHSLKLIITDHPYG